MDIIVELESTHTHTILELCSFSTSPNNPSFPFALKLLQLSFSSQICLKKAHHVFSSFLHFSSSFWKTVDLPYKVILCGFGIAWWLTLISRDCFGHKMRSPERATTAHSNVVTWTAPPSRDMIQWNWREFLNFGCKSPHNCQSFQVSTFGPLFFSHTCQSLVKLKVEWQKFNIW